MCAKQIAIDIGTSNTLIFVKGQGIVLQEPTVVSININNNKILAVGYEAQKMIGKTPMNIEVIKPLKFGSIDQFDIAKAMLEKFIERVGEGKKFFNTFSRAKVLVGVPSGVTQVERKGIEEVIREAGAKQVMVVKSVVAAAIGSGASINKPKITFIVDIGGGTTDIAAITLGGILVENSIKVGGNNFDTAIIQYLKKQYNVNIGDMTAENIKIKIGDALGVEDLEIEATGQNLTTGLPVPVNITSKEILKAIEQPLSKIILAIKKVIEQCPPESAADILENGVLLTGGSSLLKNFDILLQRELKIQVTRVQDPLLIVIQGLGITLDHLDLLNSMMLEYNARDIQDINNNRKESKPKE
jgi:rod shape-determining protein MreB